MRYPLVRSRLVLRFHHGADMVGLYQDEDAGSLRRVDDVPKRSIHHSLAATAFPLLVALKTILYPFSMNVK